ncbi:MAG: hypothetical protein ACJ8C4_12070 [Gemmataceae bacterium]
MKRTATTLIEVLISIFIMALGLVALLTLFPVGATTMAKGVQNERAAQVAASAASQFRMYWKRLCDDAASLNSNDGTMLRIRGTSATAVNSVTNTPVFPYFDVDGQWNGSVVNTPVTNPQMLWWFPYAMDDPNIGITTRNFAFKRPGLPFSSLPVSGSSLALAETNAQATSLSPSPSYPVYLDPIGWLAAGGGTNAQATWLGLPSANMTLPKTTAIPRRTMCVESWKEVRYPGPTTNLKFQSWTQLPKNLAARSFYLQDDMTFDDNGMAAASAPPEHADQYSFAYLLRRDVNADRTNVHLSVVVYLRRSVDSASDESSYYATPDQSLTTGQTSNKVTLHYDPTSQSRPAIRRGSWILDATMYDQNPTSGVIIATPQGYFYRVAEVSEPYSNGTDLSVDVNLDTDLRSTTDMTARSRIFVVPEGVLEVYDKGSIQMTSPSRVN